MFAFVPYFLSTEAAQTSSHNIISVQYRKQTCDKGFDNLSVKEKNVVLMHYSDACAQAKLS